jgi:preprotein translocase subunit SecA
MGVIYRFLGLTVGCLQSGSDPYSEERRAQYACDITYGTNSEFGFDYLREASVTSPEGVMQRGHHYAIVDEIDSILVDEARTPLIISGPVAVSTHRYDQLKPGVAEMFRRQSLMCARLVQEAKKVFDEDSPADADLEEAALNLVKVRLCMPKQKQLMHLLEEPAIRKRVERKEAEVHSDNNRGFLQEVKETLYFSMDERQGGAELTEKGRQQLRPDDPEAFVIPDLAAQFSQIDSDSSLSELEKTQRRQSLQERFEIQSETIHNISQLLRAYCLFEKDVQYIVQDGKVMIVDEFTGRVLAGRRFSEGLHQALEAKEDVQIERETQTLASITIQNYFRMYDKLAGMTGTAETEATEFKEIYNLEVVVIPTNRPCVRVDHDDRIYKTKREKYAAIIDEIVSCHERGQPVLVGTVSVDVSEVISRMLQRRRIPHSVLNAKQHQSEAEIVARAGQHGVVTIATNMAGRGTDIKLGTGVKELGGLHVIGSERHDSRRIDRQLRGRCARQGDPGSSRFYVSLEDNLMRLFGSDRVAGIMERLGLQEGEELSHRFLNRSIERAQRRVEQQHFSIRKRTLEYDDVMNNQRKVVYGLRRQALMTETPREMLFDFVYTTISEEIEAVLEQTPAAQAAFDRVALMGWLRKTFPIHFEEEALFEGAGKDVDTIAGRVVDQIEAAYQLKEKTEPPEALRWLERQIMLNAIDVKYREHLYAMDSLRQGVQLRAYGQRDPLVEYKQEAYLLFSTLMVDIKELICSTMFRSATSLNAYRRMFAAAPQQEHHDQLGQFESGGSGSQEAAEPRPVITIRREVPKVGRNDPCPCGSGKKYKKCCGR